MSIADLGDSMFDKQLHGVMKALKRYANMQFVNSLHPSQTLDHEGARRYAEAECSLPEYFLDLHVAKCTQFLEQYVEQEWHVFYMDKGCTCVAIGAPTMGAKYCYTCNERYNQRMWAPPDCYCGQHYLSGPCEVCHTIHMAEA